MSFAERYITGLSESFDLDFLDPLAGEVARFLELRPLMADVNLLRMHDLERGLFGLMGMEIEELRHALGTGDPIHIMEEAADVSVFACTIFAQCPWYELAPWQQQRLAVSIGVVHHTISQFPGIFFPGMSVGMLNHKVVRNHPAIAYQSIPGEPNGRKKRRHDVTRAALRVLRENGYGEGGALDTELWAEKGWTVDSGGTPQEVLSYLLDKVELYGFVPAMGGIPLSFDYRGSGYS